MAKANNSKKAKIVMVAQRYKMIPVDMQTYEQLLTLCETQGFGRRGQGAMVRKLVKGEYEKLPKVDAEEEQPVKEGEQA